MQHHAPLTLQWSCTVKL